MMLMHGEGFDHGEGDFYKHPQPLGRPIPLDEHAVSVSLPTWADVVGYEEGDKRVSDSMQIGYPRFKVHASIEKLIQIVNVRYEVDVSKQACTILPSQSVALAFVSFLKCADGETAIIPLGFVDVHAVLFPDALKKEARQFWQHTGEIASSRLAEDCLLFMNVGLKTSDWGVTAQHSRGEGRLSISDNHMVRFRQNQKEEIEQAALGSLIADETASLDSVLNIIRDRISTIVEERRNMVTVCVSGMAAIFAALKCVQALGKSTNPATAGKIVVFGFPYLDTLKLMQLEQLNPSGCLFLGGGDETDLNLLEAELKEYRDTHSEALEEGSPTGGIAAVFTEFPSNPLLKCPNLRRLSALADEYCFLLIVDDTIGNFANVDLLHSKGVRADILCSSLTKIFNGRGDVLAGSIVINSHTHDVTSESDDPSSRERVLRMASLRALRASRLQSIVATLDLPSLYIADAVTLEVNSRDFPARSSRINNTALALAQWLSSNPSVASLYYGECDMYKSVLRKSSDSTGYGTGYGCLMSIVLNRGLDEKAFFDALEVSKGPSLGTNFTISCPYTLLAHYTELDWAESNGVDRRLIRVSVGLEDFEDLKDRFERALKVTQVSRI
jgi:cystathionine gamma-synthase